ncbi:tetratricopeptide repeat protein [Aquimarina sp. 2201CG5-10]|uniref:tetratricopeptide repeat protein n=1 Tax=Aquimarina callyspongiae TaxID=3098150 RepID=UPI002AB39952|nr:tetratricopeptide repeat protein [Aquimarina sp. 2201CG5-10]MDY8137373.1 tetratricopeptide repeat protein [Aquimarina sp. 2201CG5-10]
MRLFNIISIFIVGITLISCQQNKKTITNSKDYSEYLQNDDKKTTKEAEQRLQFWNKKIKKDSIQISAMAPAAEAYSQLFQSSGDIKYLKLAEKLLTKSAKVAAIKKEGYLLALARNYISQHRFSEAMKAAEAAFMLHPNKASKMVLFDVSMELGDYTKAQKYLEQITNHSDYNFLIRLAKWSDYKGNLDATIRYMEKAKDIAERSKKKSLMLWSYTNLADYYGHAGRIKESYEHYLRALQIDPSNAYAKKGIAWIVYSYEYNPKEALRIIDAVTKTYKSPDYFLLKAEIAEFQKDGAIKKAYLKKYTNAVQDQRYGKMYNAYNAKILAEEYEDYDKALQIANEEVDSRPTPESYDLLAYIYYLKGEKEKALSIAMEYIVNKTYEPEANYHIAEIYKANGLTEKVDPLKKELIESGYELGPITLEKIKNL